MQQEGQDAVPPAPKIIHFVWAGGKGFMPPESMEIVLQWLIKNPDFTIYLWVDEKTGLNVDDMLLYYDGKFQNIFYALPNDGGNRLNSVLEPPFVVYEKSTQKELIPGKIILKDISRNNLRSDWVSYFIELPTPNYGASSDLLRERILELGGVYFDSDVGPGPTCLGTLPFFNEIGGHRLLLDDFMQVSDLKEEQLASPFRLKNPALNQYVGNDVLGSTKKNPLLRCLYDFSINRLLALGNSQNEAQRFAFCYGARDIKYLSIYATGPSALRDCIQSYPNHFNNVTSRGGIEVVISEPPGFWGSLWGSPSGSRVQIIPMRHSDANPISPLVPTNSWLKETKNDYANVKELKIAIGNVIMFEFARFNIVRVDDHIQDLIERSREFDERDQFNEETAFEFICQAAPVLRRPESRARLLLKVTGKFEVSLRELRDALPKTTSGIKNMISCMSYWGEFCGHFTNEKKIREGSKFLESLRKNFEESGVLFPTMGNIFRFINASLDAFAVYCKPRIAFLAPELEIEARVLIGGYLQKYLSFIDRLIATVPAKAFVGYKGQKPDELRTKILDMVQGLSLGKGNSIVSSVRVGKK
ncbi:MAG TPA: hypothetical protein VGV92_00845 [Gammaproteobacteria bacterium]|nr:hypothetical protein [Gammaproteobacteria bacterium]